MSEVEQGLAGRCFARGVGAALNEQPDDLGLVLVWPIRASHQSERVFGWSAALWEQRRQQGDEQRRSAVDTEINLGASIEQHAGDRREVHVRSNAERRRTLRAREIHVHNPLDHELHDVAPTHRARPVQHVTILSGDDEWIQDALDHQLQDAEIGLRPREVEQGHGFSRFEDTRCALDARFNQPFNDPNVTGGTELDGEPIHVERVDAARAQDEQVRRASREERIAEGAILFDQSALESVYDVRGLFEIVGRGKTRITADERIQFGGGWGVRERIHQLTAQLCGLTAQAEAAAGLHTLYQERAQLRSFLAVARSEMCERWDRGTELALADVAHHRLVVLVEMRPQQEVIPN